VWGTPLTALGLVEAWDAEVARRIEDLKAGKAVTVPWEELHRELLAMVNEGLPSSIPNENP